MRVPVIQGVIDRRILVNYRADPASVERLLPEPFRPQLVEGKAVVGVCLIRLHRVRPLGWPARVGIASENAAHRIAVGWDEQGEARHGVYVPRRHTSSRLNAAAGGRFFPGVHQQAEFAVRESEGMYQLRLSGKAFASIWM